MLRLGCLGLLIFPLWVNAAADDLELLGGELNLHGRIIDQPCVVAPESLEQEVDRKSTRLNSSHNVISRMPSSA